MMLKNNDVRAHEQYLIESQPERVCAYYKFVYTHLADAHKYYPDFYQWFFSRVVPDIKSGKRELLIESRDNYVAGIAIVNPCHERKLCTLRVIDRFQNKGIGIKLFERCFEALETDSPFLTVSEEKLPSFKKVFDYYGFELTNVCTGTYRKGKKEYFFNEV